MGEEEKAVNYLQCRYRGKLAQREVTEGFLIEIHASGGDSVLEAQKQLDGFTEKVSWIKEELTSAGAQPSPVQRMQARSHMESLHLREEAVAEELYASRVQYAQSTEVAAELASEMALEQNKNKANVWNEEDVQSNLQYAVGAESVKSPDQNAELALAETREEGPPSPSNMTKTNTNTSVTVATATNGMRVKKTRSKKAAQVGEMPSTKTQEKSDLANAFLALDGQVIKIAFPSRPFGFTSNRDDRVRFRVGKVHEGSFAAEAHIKPGWYLNEVNGTDTKATSADRTENILKNTSVPATLVFETVAFWESYAPQEIFIDEGWACECYQRVPDTKVHGFPLWKRDDGKRWIFSSTKGRWVIGGEAAASENFEVDTGIFASRRKHGADMPNQIQREQWLKFDNSKELWVPVAPGRRFDHISKAWNPPPPAGGIGFGAVDLRKMLCDGEYVEMMRSELKEAIDTREAAERIIDDEMRVEHWRAELAEATRRVRVADLALRQAQVNRLAKETLAAANDDSTQSRSEMIKQVRLQLEQMRLDVETVKSKKVVLPMNLMTTKELEAFRMVASPPSRASSTSTTTTSTVTTSSTNNLAEQPSSGADATPISPLAGALMAREATIQRAVLDRHLLDLAAQPSGGSFERVPGNHPAGALTARHAAIRRAVLDRALIVSRRAPANK